MFYLEEGHGLKNIAMDPETRRSKNVFHYYAGVQPEDIDGDGCMDVPVAQSVPAYGESSADRFWWLQWMHYRVDGSRDLVMTTYHSGDGWYLEIPEDWTGEFSMRRQESSTIGVRTVTFARGEKAQTEAEESKTVPFLEISCLVGSDRTRQARQGNRFILCGQHHHLHRRISGERLGLRFGPGGAESPVPCGLGTAGTPGSKCPRNTKNPGRAPSEPGWGTSPNLRQEEQDDEKILVLEDEANIRSFVVINLNRAGYETIEAGTGEEALEQLRLNPDVRVALLDIMLPDIDGFEVCRRIRAGNSKIGIIMLTARTQEMDKVTGLMTGADDYMTKPFSPAELTARIGALYRRIGGGT